MLQPRSYNSSSNGRMICRGCLGVCAFIWNTPSEQATVTWNLWDPLASRISNRGRIGRELGGSNVCQHAATAPIRTFGNSWASKSEELPSMADERLRRSGEFKTTDHADYTQITIMEYLCLIVSIVGCGESVALRQRRI